MIKRKKMRKTEDMIKIKKKETTTKKAKKKT